MKWARTFTYSAAGGRFAAPPMPQNCSADAATVKHWKSALARALSALDATLALAGRTLTVGIVGGSISAGSGVNHPRLTFAGQLTAGSERLRVVNRAVRATGSAFPSFCLEELLPEPVDVLVVEFATNDGHFGEAMRDRSLGAPSSGSSTMAAHDSAHDRGPRLGPSASMERLLRRVRQASAEPLILYMCRPPRQPAAPPCEGLYSDVATAYHTRELSLAKAMGEAISNVAWAEGRTQSTIPSARAASASSAASPL